MKAQTPKLNIRKEDVFKKIKENPEFYNNRENAVNTYNLVLKNYKLIKFKSSREQAHFNEIVTELRKAILSESKDLFIHEFAKATCNIEYYLQESTS